MTASRWREIDELFQLVAEWPRESRASFLSGRCAQDPELRREVESLLAADDGAEAFVACKFAGLDVLADIADGTIPAGGRAGEYRVVRLLGSGGMGSVYLAERDDGEFHQQVAIKFVRGGEDRDWAKSRFRIEREILARLNHPNIARLLGGGTTANGTPYLVMEHVEGLAMQVWLSRNQPSIREILEVFAALCQAVAYAHRNLIVHRDIKPGNVLIQANGVPKLLDFGISKPIVPGDDSTVTLQRAMTPAYASPEQVRGELVSTATDVYSLGAILYEALAGRPPFELAGATPAEAERAICERDPLPLGGVPSDLAKVVLKAMHRAPERRYSSAENLAADLRRFLDGHPVNAQGDSYWYRLRKFIARRRGPAALSAALVILIIIFAANLLVTASRQRQAFGRMRDMAKSTLLDVPERIAGRSAGDIRLELGENYDKFAEPLARQLQKEVGVIREIALGYEKLGLVLGIADARAMGDSEVAIGYFQKAIRLVEPLRGSWFDRIMNREALEGSRAIEARSHCNIGRLLEMEGASPAAEYEKCLAIYETLVDPNPKPGAHNLKEFVRAHLLVGSVAATAEQARSHFETVVRISVNQQAHKAVRNAPLLWEADGLWRLWRLDSDRGKLEAARRAITEARVRGASFDVDSRLLELRIVEDWGSAGETHAVREALRRDLPGHPLVRRTLASGY